MNKKLAQLSRDFKPDNVHFSLSPTLSATKEEVEEEAAKMIGRLKRYIDNGHSCKGLDFDYGEVRVLYPPSPNAERQVIKNEMYESSTLDP